MSKIHPRSCKCLECYDGEKFIWEHGVGKATKLKEPIPCKTSVVKIKKRVESRPEAETSN